MKLLKNLFTVPAGEKVTERHFKRVLISSVCGILLCMTCLMSSTWAWFTATMDSAPFGIQVAEASIAVTVNGTQVSDGNTISLNAGAPATVVLTFQTDATANSFNATPSRYIVLSVYDADKSSEGSYFIAVDSNSNKCTLTLSTDEPCTVFFTPAWQPLLVENSELKSGDSVVLIDLPDETTVPATEPKEEGQEKPDDSQQPITESGTDTTTEPSTEATTEPTTEQTGQDEGASQEQTQVTE